MSRIYDNWERFVAATLNREKLRELAFCPSFSSSSSAHFSSRFSVDSLILDVSAAPAITSNPCYGHVRHMPYKEIEKATRNFRSDLFLGQGGFGVVYKGWIYKNSLTAARTLMRSLSLSVITVAVKKWIPRNIMGLKEWMTEIKFLSQLDHPNIIKLIGYCNESENVVLVYEFQPKGSLQEHLFTRMYLPLSWDTRIKVAIDTARGLSFLHKRELQIIHCNFHVGDILIDEEFNAKLSCFYFAMNATDVSSDLPPNIGTHDYGTHEYAKTGRVTTQSDVFAYGVVLLEILTGRRYYKIIKDKILEMAKAYTNDKLCLPYIIDANLEGQFPPNGAHSALSLACQCLNSNPSLRPTMSDVLGTLQRL